MGRKWRMCVRQGLKSVYSKVPREGERVPQSSMRLHRYRTRMNDCIELVHVGGRGRRHEHRVPGELDRGRPTRMPLQANGSETQRRPVSRRGPIKAV